MAILIVLKMCSMVPVQQTISNTMFFNNVLSNAVPSNAEFFDIVISVVKRAGQFMLLVSFAIVLNLSAMGQTESFDQSGGVDDFAIPVDAVPIDSVSDEQIRMWIEQLSASEFSVRETATGQLVAASEQALPVLVESLELAENAEQLSRLKSLVQFVRREVVQRRLDDFVFDPNPENDHGFSAWPRFSKMAGITRTSKLLLIEMYKEHPTLLNELGDCLNNSDSEIEPGTTESKQLASAAITLADNTRKKLQGPSAGDGLALLFLSATLPKPVPKEVQLTTEYCVRIVPLAARFNSDRWKVPMHRLANLWMERIDISDSYIAERAMQFGVSYKIENTTLVARKTLERKESAIITKTAALQALCKTGQPSDIETIEGFFSDSSLVNDTVMPNESTELRDIALAAALVLRRGSLNEYFPQAVNSGVLGFSITDIRFPTLDPTIRTNAFKRYEMEYSADIPFEPQVEKN